MIKSIMDFDILNRFGQPTLEWAKHVKTSTPAKMTSIDDFNKYFDKKMYNYNLEKSPKSDVLVKSSQENEKFSDIPDIFDRLPN